MSKWELLTEIKDTGYYIGWRRIHPNIHMPIPMQPMSKTSLVQIGGQDGLYQVRGLTYAHSIFLAHEHKAGLKLFDESHHSKTIEEARTKATELKRKIAKLFDDVSRSDSLGNLIMRSILKGSLA